MATEAQIDAAVDAVMSERREKIEQLVRTVAQHLEDDDPAPDSAAPCREILAALQEAQHLFGEIGDSQGRSIGIILSRRAFQMENRCRAAVKSLRALIED